MMEKKQKDCIFCKIANKEIDAEIVEESENFIAFPDANPVTKGHTLIVSKKHFANIMDLPSDLGGELMDIVKRVAEKRMKEGAEGFHIGMNNFPAAQQEVMHAHIHIMPRKKGDGYDITKCWR